MKRIRQFIMPVLLLAFMLAGVAACTEGQRKEIKHIKSDLIGLKRKITLYDANGRVIREWEGRFKIEIQGAYISFIDDQGKEIKLGGTVVVEEI